MPLPCASLTEELDEAAALIRSWSAEDGVLPETVAILVRDRHQRDRVVAGLGERGVEIRAVDSEAVRSGRPVAMTMHRAKGTEFARVLLFGVKEGRRLRADFGNGMEFYAKLGESISVPARRDERPSVEAVTWHMDEVFLR